MLLEVEKLSNILKWIHPEEFDNRHKAVAQPRAQDSGEWFLNLKVYKKWSDGSSSKVLFCYGMRTTLELSANVQLELGSL